MDISRIVISSILALLLLSTGGGKLAGTASSQAIRDSLHVAPARWRAIGVGEIVIVAGLVAGIWLTAVDAAAGIGVALLMVGAISTRVRAGDDQKRGIAGDAAVFLVAAALTALSIAVG